MKGLGNKLYTFFFEFKEGTYIRQATGESLKKALTNWAGALMPERIIGAHDGFKRELLEGLEDVLTNEGISAVTGLKNVWCCSFLFSDDSLGIVTITITDGCELT
ncbi:MAG: hypothetical protein IPJ30_03895 [Acidobacteria bacterium]|nr:hypothetical protein [Acidobacteriota bacterium]MBK8148970.1 hypothetical protein [Acidobacteriota bacterium]